MVMTHRTDLLILCDALHKAGIWLSLTDTDALIVGPTALVTKHPQLLQGVRDHKQALIQLLEDSLAHSVFGDRVNDSRFEREVCPDCQQQCLIVLGPRRLGVHRTADGKTTCPGSDRAQAQAAELIMQAFIDDRCLARPGAVLSWYSIRGALETWCLELTFLLPPRPFVLAWLDAHFTRHGNDDERPMWQGLTLTLAEWGLDDPTEKETPTQATVSQKLVLKA